MAHRERFEDFQALICLTQTVLKTCSPLLQQVVRLFQCVDAFLKCAHLHTFVELRADGPVASLRCRRTESRDALEGRREYCQVWVRPQHLIGYIEAGQKLETSIVNAR